jgi:type I restriction enzyme M protein
VSSALYTNRDAFLTDLAAAFKAAGVEVKAALLKTIWQALSQKDDSADVCVDKKGRPEPDSDLRVYENVPLKEEIDDYFRREVLPYVPNAWIDRTKTKIGYEIPFNRHFYTYTPPRPLEEIDADLDKVSAEIMQLLKEVHV